MQQMAKQFHCFNNTGTAAMQIGVAVNCKHLSLPDRFQSRPSWLLCQRGDFSQGLWQVEPAGCDKQDVRIECHYVLPIVVDALMTSVGETIFAPGGLNQVGSPVRCQHQGGQPLNADRAGALNRSADPALDGLQTLLQQRLPVLGFGLCCRCVADALNVGKNFMESSRLQGE